MLILTAVKKSNLKKRRVVSCGYGGQSQKPAGLGGVCICKRTEGDICADGTSHTSLQVICIIEVSLDRPYRGVISNAICMVPCSSPSGIEVIIVTLHFSAIMRTQLKALRSAKCLHYL